VIEFVEGALDDGTPLVQQDDAVGNELGAVQVVGDHDGGDFALFLQLQNEFVDLTGGDGIETSGGLVEQQNAGVEGQGAREAHALLHAAGNVAGEFLQIIFHPHGAEQLRDAVGAF
jgi:hypothetical protein